MKGSFFATSVSESYNEARCDRIGIPWDKSVLRYDFVLLRSGKGREGMCGDMRIFFSQFHCDGWPELCHLILICERVYTYIK
jgi:hypothetical protein